MKWNRRQWLSGVFALVAAMLVAGLVACNDNSTPAAGGGGGGTGGKKKVAVVISTYTNDWFTVLRDTAVARATELGYDATAFNSDNDLAKESQAFDTIIAQKYDAILLNCTDADGSVKNVRRAKEAGIPVFCMDREINATDAATSQVLSDSASACVKLGEYFVKRLNEKGNYVELQGILADNNSKTRSSGFHSVVDRYPNIKMVAQQPANFDRSQGETVMTAMLAANKDIDAVFCANDQMALGAYQALLAAKRDNKVLVFGFDGADDVIKSIAEGKIAATAMQYPKKMAQMVAEDADKYIKGERNFQQKMLVAVDVVTKDNVAQFGNFGKLDAK